MEPVSTQSFAACPTCRRYAAVRRMAFLPITLGDRYAFLHVECGACGSTRIPTRPNEAGVQVPVGCVDLARFAGRASDAAGEFLTVAQIRGAA